MDNRAYILDLRKWVLLLLPTALRRDALYHLVYVLVVPLVTVYRSFYQRRQTSLFYARYDSGRGNIERMLNILFCGGYDHSNRQIEVANAITTSIEYEHVYVTTAVEDDSAIVGGYIDSPKPQDLVEVRVPAALMGQQDKIGKLVGNYLLPNVGFKIIQKA